MTTAAERRHLGRLAAMGCIVCLREGFGETPCEIHHLRHGQGMSQRASHYQAIGLCHTHHRTGGYGVAFHAGPKAFEDRFGSESDLLIDTRQRLGIKEVA